MKRDKPSTKSQRNVFRRLSITARAKIIDRHNYSEPHIRLKDFTYGVGGACEEVGCILGLIAYLITSIFRFYRYKLIVQFSAIRPNDEIEQVTLEAMVSSNIYNRYPVGSIVEVRYLKEKPWMVFAFH